VTAAPAAASAVSSDVVSPVRDVVSPVFGAVQVVRPGSTDPDAPQARAEVRIDASEPVFEGHYPDFPIFPGVCVVECVHRSALATAPGGAALTLASLDSARFVGAVFPGDVLGIDITWKAVDDGLRCQAVASTARGTAAKVRLTYAVGVLPA
jgi:3-hydroxyacyl-[acyl-carrier-protein] dehydratase